MLVIFGWLSEARPMPDTPALSPAYAALVAKARWDYAEERCTLAHGRTDPCDSCYAVADAGLAPLVAALAALSDDAYESALARIGADLGLSGWDAIDWQKVESAVAALRADLARVTAERDALKGRVNDLEARHQALAIPAAQDKRGGMFCEVCAKPIRDGQPYQHDTDGVQWHTACMDARGTDVEDVEWPAP